MGEFKKNKSIGNLVHWNCATVTQLQVVQGDLMIGVHILSREMDVITVKVILFLFFFVYGLLIS